MNTKLHKVLPISAAAVLFATLATSAAADEVVKIGHVASLTRSIAHLGKDNENGARLAVEEINAKGLTIGGQKITPPSATNPTYTQQGFKTTYRVVATDAQQGPAFANYAAKGMKVKSVAVVDDSTAYGQGFANEFEKTAKSLGIKVVSHDATNDKAVDFRAILTKIKGENPDPVMYGGMAATGEPIRQASQVGLRAKVLAGDGVCTEKLADLAGDATDNVVCSEAGIALEKMDGGAAFQAKYQKRFGQPIQIYAPFTYDALYIIVDAMKRANSVDPAKILAAMPNTDYKGVLGETTSIRRATSSTA